MWDCHTPQIQIWGIIVGAGVSKLAGELPHYFVDFMIDVYVIPNFICGVHNF
jgi:hypothetical protein